LTENKKIILLTGGAGYIGSHTCVSLVQNGFTPLIIDNFSNSFPYTIKKINKLVGKMFFFEKGDICDLKFLNHIFKKYTIFGIIHFAALKSIPESYLKQKKYFEVNINGTKKMLKMCKKYDCNFFIFSSSAAIYDQNQSPPYSENSKINPLNPYSRSKYFAEKEIAHFSHLKQDFRFIVLRYFNPVGAHESGYLNENPKKGLGNLMPQICKTANGDRKFLNIYGNQYDTSDGTCIRDFIHVVDLAEGHVKALNYLINKKKNSTFNLGTGKGITVMNVIKTFEKINNIKVKYKIRPPRVGDAKSSFANTFKASKFLKWRANKNLASMCESSWYPFLK